MDSAKVFHNNNYEKIKKFDLEDQSPISPTNNTHSYKPFVYFIIISMTIFNMVYIHRTYQSIKDSFSSTSYLDSNSYHSIEVICNTTLYPDSCFNSISSIYTVPKPDPETILKLSLQVAITEVSTLSSDIKNASINSSLAMKDCEHLLEDAVRRLNSSVAMMEVAAGEKMLTDKKMSDIQTWVSAALADHETCMDGLEEAASTVVIGFKDRVEQSKEYVSNALAILANIRLLLDQFGQTLH